MKFLERIFGCFHDWETIRYSTKSRLLNEIAEKINSASFRSLLKIPNDTEYVNKVCLKCKEYVDEITPAYNNLLVNYRNKLTIEKQRKDKTESILKELKIKE